MAVTRRIQSSGWGHCELCKGERRADPCQVGILAGHTYVFLQDYWPREMWSESGKGEIKTPAIV